jgi:predicted metal-dependent phosphoesterase TrpH
MIRFDRGARRSFLVAGTAAVLFFLATRIFGAPVKTKVRELQKLPAIGFLAYEVKDAKTGELMPAKLTLVGTGGTPEPFLTRGDIGREEEGAIAAYNRIFSLSGSGVIIVPPGTFDVYVSRGIEWELAVQRGVKIDDKRVATVRAALAHVVDTPGWISADLHVHASPSADSVVPMRDRIYEFVTDGVEIIAGTDHNVVSDYQPVIAELGVGEYIAALIGDEVTTNGWGHFGVFPIEQHRDRSGHGAFHVHGRTAREMFADIHDEAPDAIIQVNHPRIDNEIGYFNAGRLDSPSDVADRAGFSFDFDAVEVLNGYQDPDRRSVDRVIADWTELLDHGHLVTATGNSDTHHLTYNLGGYPRNYIAMQDDRPAHVTPQRLANAIRDRHVFFTTGPIVSLSVAGGQIGDLVTTHGGVAHADLSVQAAPWISVSRVLLYVNGAEVKRWDVPDSQDVQRFKDGYDFEVTRDSYVFARVDGNRLLAPVVGDPRRFTVLPFALTNPVFLDVDGKSQFTPLKSHGAHPPLRRRYHH